LRKHCTYLLICLIVGLKVSAMHIVGGEITYTYNGNNSYHIKVKVYRDCASNGAQFDNPLHLGIFSATGLDQVIGIPFVGSSPVNDPLVAPCIVPPDNVCVEFAIYETDVILPVSPGGYDIVYQRCCRNSSIININFPDETGATYVTHIDPSNNLAQINNAASFTSLPPIFLCVNTPFSYDNSATDIDNDSLVYSFCNPYSGASSSAPLPNPPSDPPYAPVQWAGTYNTNNQISGNPTFTIDPLTGLITGTPNQLGQYVIGVRVQEYRNGVLIGETRRDFQFNVLPCENAIASIPQQETFCTGLSVNFSNTSFNSTNYIWDFGDTTSTADVSTLATTSYTYPGPGNYTVTLIAYNPAGNCYDTATTNFNVAPLLAPTFLATNPLCFFNNSYSYSVGGSYDASATFQWNFGDAVPSTSIAASPTNIHFNTDTIQNFNVIVSQFGCSDTVEYSQAMYPRPTADIGEANKYCIGLQVDFQDSCAGAIGYYWDFGVPGITSDFSFTQNPSYLFPDTGIYTVTLVATNEAGCKDTAAEQFLVYPLFSPTIYPFNDSNFVNQCADANLFNFYADGLFSNQSAFTWTFGPNANVLSANTQDVLGVTFNQAGIFPVKVSAEENGCVKSYTDSVRIYNRPQIGYRLDEHPRCLPATLKFTDTSYAETPIFYIWDFGDNTQSNQVSPNHTYTSPGDYTVSLTIITNTGCKDTQSYTYPEIFQFNPPPIAKFSVDSNEVSYFTPTIEVTDLSINSVSCKYLISDSTEYNVRSFAKTFGDTGMFKIAQIVYAADGCTDTVNDYVHVNPEFRIWIPNAFTPNNDDINDVFLPYTLGVRKFDFKVFDRWGVEIFQSLNKYKGWDGTYKEEICQEGIYNYIFEYIDIFGRTTNMYGKIALIR
jgi:gliding motility-associated-like protein